MCILRRKLILKIYVCRRTLCGSICVFSTFMFLPMSSGPYLPWEIADDVFRGPITLCCSGCTYSVDKQRNKCQCGRKEKNDNERDDGTKSEGDQCDMLDLKIIAHEY